MNIWVLAAFTSLFFIICRLIEINFLFKSEDSDKIIRTKPKIIARESVFVFLSVVLAFKLTNTLLQTGIMHLPKFMKGGSSSPNQSNIPIHSDYPFATTSTTPVFT
tara:strand:+ start:323 stop:640 length:318 start_codon:yes stop_codon:yes gene_type:complete